jgi:hypothetical protein
LGHGPHFGMRGEDLHGSGAIANAADETLRLLETGGNIIFTEFY